MTDQRERHSFYWERFLSEGAPKQPPRPDLAALRRGVNAEPGTVPAMWPFYSTWQDGDERPWRLDAEHQALTLFAVHQQSTSYLVHRPKLPFAQTLAKLHASGKFSKDAVDRRFYAAVTSAGIVEVGYHLRSLVRQLHSLDIPTPFDYTALYRDLEGWQFAERRSRTQRRWGLEYNRQVIASASENVSATNEGDQ